jgi:hypothetical protein
MDRVRPPKRGWRDFGEPQISHLAESHQVAHRADGLLNRHGGVDAMQVIEVNNIDTEPAEGSIACALDIGRLPSRARSAPGLLLVTKPNFVARMTPARLSRSALPTWISDTP